MLEKEFKKINIKHENINIFSKKVSQINNDFISAAFFDRDGVVIEDCHYIKNPEDVKLCPGVKKLFREFYEKNFSIIIINSLYEINRKTIRQ